MSRVPIQLVIDQANTLLNYIKRSTIPYVNGGMSLTGMDCQGLVEYCFIQAGVPKAEIDLSGSNRHFRAMRYTCTPEECKKLFGETPAGATLFILDHDGGEPLEYKKDGAGNASHMGLWTGKTSIAASASRGKVTESNYKGKTINGGWNMVGFDKHTIYAEKVEAVLAGLTGSAVGTDNAADAAQPAAGWFKPRYSHMTFALGSMGRGTEEIQTALNMLGYKLEIDSRFGPMTDEAVIRFQKVHGLEPDGKVGPATWKALIDAVNAA